MLPRLSIAHSWAQLQMLETPFRTRKNILCCLVFQIVIQALVRIVRSSDYCPPIDEATTMLNIRTKDLSQCWTLHVPKDYYVRINITGINFHNRNCYEAYLNIKVGTGEFTLCHGNSIWQPIIEFNDVIITFFYSNYYKEAQVSLTFTKETFICTQKNHFRCSQHVCIYKYQVCDGRKDCEDEADEIGCGKGFAAIKGVNISLANAVTWLKKQQLTSYGWAKNTHRAITALYLTGNLSFKAHSIDNDMIDKQLELKTLVALLRNNTDPLSISDLSLFVNSLMVACHNPRNFYGYNLIKILKSQVAESNLPNPGAYLSLCSANETIPERHTKRLLNVLQNQSGYLFHSDVQAMAIMALSCIKNKTDDFDIIDNASEIYEKSIQGMIYSQQPDGSFGNIYTTGIVAQALISSEQENNSWWNLNATAQYLMKGLISPDFLLVYLVLPAFNGKSLVDISSVKCESDKKPGKDNEIVEGANTFRGKMQIQYSLYVGDVKDVIHTMYLRMPENCSAYNVMEMAQSTDSKYKFLSHNVSGYMYVFQISGLTNDPETGKYWLLYLDNDDPDGIEKHINESPENVLIQDGDHLIMWYKTAKLKY